MATDLGANALTTVDAVLAILCLDSTVELREQLTRLINAASDKFERDTGRKFQRLATVENVAGYGTDKISVERYPIKTVTSIEYKGGAIDTTDLVVDSDSGLLQLPGGFASTAHLNGGISTPILPGSELPYYAVTLTSGYVLPYQHELAGAPVDGDPRDLPFDIEEAVVDWVSMRYRARQRDPSIKSEKLETWSATYTAATSTPLFDETVFAYSVIF